MGIIEQVKELTRENVLARVREIAVTPKGRAKFLRYREAFWIGPAESLHQVIGMVSGIKKPDDAGSIAVSRANEIGEADRWEMSFILGSFHYKIDKPRDARHETVLIARRVFRQPGLRIVEPRATAL